MTLQQEQKSNVDLTKQKILRQHTTSADKKIFSWYCFLVLIYEINLRNYRIFSNKHPYPSSNFESFWWGAYWRAALKRGGRLFQARMLNSLAGCLTELLLISIEFSFHFGFLCYPSFVSIFRIFSSGFSVRPKSSYLDIPRTIIKCDYIN